MKKTIAATIIALAVSVFSIGGGSASATNECSPFSKVYEWKYSSNSGSLVLDEFSWDVGVTAKVTVTVTNNVGYPNVPNPYHNATLSVGGKSFPIERAEQGAVTSFNFTLPGGVNYVPTITSTDGWSSQITFTFECQKPAPTTTVPVTTEPAPTTTQPPVTTVPEVTVPVTTTPVPETSAPTTTVAVSEPPAPTTTVAPAPAPAPTPTYSLPATGAKGTAIALLIATILVVAGVAARRYSRK